MKAGFSRATITPPPGTGKIGWIKKITILRALDDLEARVCVLEADGTRAAIVQLDVLCATRSVTAGVRELVERDHGFPGANVMVAATHNQAGPAVAGEGVTPKDEKYVAGMLNAVSSAFGRALSGMAEAQMGHASEMEHFLPLNRRVVMRDGLVRTHGPMHSPDALFIEGPVDPELAVIAFRSKGGDPLGLIVNFACHVTDHGDDECCTAGYPGIIAREMAGDGWPVALYLTGAAGNICTHDKTMEQSGEILSGRVRQALGRIRYGDPGRLSCASETVRLPYRTVTEDEIRGTVRGAQRFIDPKLYDEAMPRVLERIRMRGMETAEVQAIRTGALVFVTLPCEPFVELGLAIKEGVHPKRAIVVGYACGMAGYVPHREAFKRGGYETTFGDGSFLAPEAGEKLVEAALRVARP